MNSLLTKFSGFDRINTIISRDPGLDAMTFTARAVEAFNVSANVLGLSETSYRSTVFLCTHHTGALDFLASFPALANAAPNLKVVMNKQLLSITPLAEVAVAVHTVSTGRKNAKAVTIIRKHLEGGGNLMLFPAGRVGNLMGSDVVDDEWQCGIVRCLQGKEVGIVPVYIDARNSRFFYLIRRLFPRLSMMLLLRALKNNRNDATVYIGQRINSRRFEGLLPDAVMQELRNETYSLKQKFILGRLP